MKRNLLVLIGAILFSLLQVNSMRCYARGVLVPKILHVSIVRNGTIPPNTPIPGFHPAPASNVITDIQAVFNQDTYVLSFKFFTEYGHCSFNIYHEGTLVINAGYAAHTGGYKTFDLSAYGPGEYEVVLENETIRGTGSFTAEDDE